MSKLSKLVKSNNSKQETINFMSGTSYTLDPVMTLKMVCASSIFGEAQYYRPSEKRYGRSVFFSESLNKYLVLKKIPEMTTQTYMEKIIDEALNHDFKVTLDIALELRAFYNVRINPQIIMVRAALHPKRKQFTEMYPGLFKTYQRDIMARADEPSTQLAYYLSLHDGKKAGIPTILKKSWADKLSSLDRYQVSKYKNAEMGMINTVRICHANSPVIDELMQTGNIQIQENEKTWQNLRSEGMTWKEIIKSDCTIGHMALLKNLRGIFTELEESEENKELMHVILDQLIKGVERGKQFPYRYYVAYKTIKDAEIVYKTFVLDALEKCLQVSLNNLPKLKGKTMVLSDNSGSAWGTLNTEYGSVKVAEIGNLSAVLTALCSEEGYVGVFGDTLKVVPIMKTSCILDNLEKVNELGKTVGYNTENGIWLFFEKSITQNEYWNHIFIYSDMQAGRGELYCTDEEAKKYQIFLRKYDLKGMKIKSYINILELVELYRKRVNPKVNLFSVQTAGYDNSVLPNYLYRGCLLTGWTGKEAVFARRMIELWDEIDKKAGEYHVN